MSKVEKIDALLESAILSFAKDGFAGASLREIANRANVALGTIYMYYGSKQDLFVTANRAIWIEICDERDTLIAEVMRDAGDEPPQLEALVRALSIPIVRRAISRSERDMAQLYVIRSRVSEWEDHEVNRALARALSGWIDTLALACPTLSRKDLLWSYCYMNGVIWSWRTIDHRYDSFLGDDLERSYDEMLDDIVNFSCSGVGAMIARRSSSAAAI